MGDPQSTEVQPVSRHTLSKDGYGITSPGGLVIYQVCFVHYDIAIYNKKYMFGLCPIPSTELLKTLKFVSTESDRGIFLC